MSLSICGTLSHTSRIRPAGLPVCRCSDGRGTVDVSLPHDSAPARRTVGSGTTASKSPSVHRATLALRIDYNSARYAISVIDVCRPNEAVVRSRCRRYIRTARAWCAAQRAACASVNGRLTHCVEIEREARMPSRIVDDQHITLLSRSTRSGKVREMPATGARHGR